MNEIYFVFSLYFMLQILFFISKKYVYTVYKCSIHRLLIILYDEPFFAPINVVKCHLFSNDIDYFTISTKERIITRANK